MHAFEENAYILLIDYVKYSTDTIAVAQLGVARPARVDRSGTSTTGHTLVSTAIEEAARHLRVTRQPWQFPIGSR